MDHGHGLLFAGEGFLGAGCGSTFALATDLVVGSVPSVRAGSAAAVNETAFEFGGALGVAILGTVQARADAGEALGGSASRAILVGAVALGVAVLVACGAAGVRRFGGQLHAARR